MNYTHYTMKLPQHLRRHIQLKLKLQQLVLQLTHRDMIASNISLVGHQHRDNPKLLVQSPQYQLVLLVLSQMQMVIVSIQSVRHETALDALDLSTQSNVTLPTSTTAYPDTLAKLDATDIITQSMMRMML